MIYHVPRQQFDYSKQLQVNAKLLVENFQFLFEFFTIIAPSVAKESILEFIEDYSELKQEFVIETIGQKALLFPHDVRQSLDYLSKIAESLIKMTVSKGDDNFVFDGYISLLEVVSDNHNPEYVSDQINRLLLDYSMLKIQELGQLENKYRAKRANELLALIELMSGAIKKVKVVFVLELENSNPKEK